MKKISLIEVKQALKDPRFRDSLPLELRDDVSKYLFNPSCACNLPLYRKLIKQYSQYLVAYFPESEISNDPEFIKELSQNHWTVINCNVAELESKLRMLPPGRKQIAVTRYQDQVTVIVDNLEVVF